MTSSKVPPIFLRAQDGAFEPCHKRFFLYGNGPHTRVIYGYLHSLEGLSGFVVDDAVVHQQPVIDEYTVVPLSQALEAYPPDEYAALVALGFRDFNRLREIKSNTLKEMGYDLASFVDESVRLPKHYHISENCILIDHVSINEGASVQSGVFVSSGAMIGHDSVLNAYSWIGSGTALAGGVHVGTSSILGLNCSVKQNVVLGHHSLVFPNTFANANTDPYEVVASPAGKKMGMDSRLVMKFAYIDSMAEAD